MTTFNIKGVVAPVFTPIDDKGCVNHDAIPDYLTYLNNHGIHAILVGGTTGEAVCLSLDERRDVLKSWIDAAKPINVNVIVQIGGAPLPEVIKMAQYAEAFKADAIMTLPELFFKPKKTEQLVAYLEIVSKAAPTLPLVYYHFPMMSGVEVNVREFFILATSRIPNFKGMKADLDVAVQVASQLGEDQRIFIGNHLLAPAVLLGHESSIATVTNLFPSLVHAIVDSTKRGNVEKAKELQEKMNKLVDAITSEGEFVPTMKTAMELVSGITVGPPRQPQAAVSSYHRNKIADNLRQLNVELYQSMKMA